ncbi:MAG TPA: hypothetical protein VHG08_28290 [Longimicrobium sp.]|nr:hypothetical protein [Longimicrobium sp.]
MKDRWKSEPERVAEWVTAVFLERSYLELDIFPLPGEYQAKITSCATTQTIRLLTLTADRSLVELLGLGTPVGFREVPLVANRRSKRSVEFVEEFNRTSINWESDTAVLRPGEPYVLRIPAERQEAGFGLLDAGFGGETEGMGGGVTFRALPIGLADPVAARKYMDVFHSDRMQYERDVGPLPPRENLGGYGTFRAQTTPFAGGRLPPRRRKEADEG